MVRDSTIALPQEEKGRIFRSGVPDDGLSEGEATTIIGVSMETYKHGIRPRGRQKQKMLRHLPFPYVEHDWTSKGNLTADSHCQCVALEELITLQTNINCTPMLLSNTVLYWAYTPSNADYTTEKPVADGRGDQCIPNGKA